MLNINNKASWFASPFIVIAAGFCVAVVFTQWIGVWAWIPVALAYWGMMAWVIIANKTKAEILAWLKPSGRCTWCIPLALIVGFLPLPILLFHYHLLDSWLLIVLWLMFALLNPWFEEGYWRGLMLDTGQRFVSGPTAVLYSTVFFILAHPFTWGVFSLANRHYHLFMVLAIMGVAWSAIYLRTKSLRWPIFSHFLVDTFNMAVLVFLNIYLPPV
jgi:uncharacterized protein